MVKNSDDAKLNTAKPYQKFLLRYNLIVAWRVLRRLH